MICFRIIKNFFSDPVFCLLSGYLIFAFVGATQADEKPEIERQVLGLQQKYHLEIIYRDLPPVRDSKLHFTPVAQTDYPLLVEYLKLLAEEWSKYPERFLAKSPLQKVYLVKKLFRDEQAVEGFAALDREIIILDFLRSRGNRLRQRHNMHHEIYHVVFSSPEGKDAEWEQLNEKDFKYGQDSKNNKEDGSENFDQPRWGFVSRYAMSAVEEDKAELFACLMMPSQHQLIRRWTTKDAILRKKVDFLKRLLQSFCEEMNDRYWQRLIEGNP